MTPEFHDALLATGAVLSDRPLEVTSFGDAVAELQAAKTKSAVFVIPSLIRIRLTGADRVKFLHNFCTNNVKEMATGDVREAFLTDVKARILGHGYIAAFSGSVEVWMLPGNAEAVAKHLQKYVIVEDVDVQIVEPTVALALAGPDALQVYSDWQKMSAPVSGSCSASEFCAAISVVWNREPLLMVSLASNQNAADAWQALDAGDAKAAGQVAFEAVRIAERFPRVDIDLSNSNMAPEAGRNETAICYSKGCYLGQEPIARLDAMGHVNRQLYAGTVQLDGDEPAEGSEKWPVVTTMTPLSDDITPALAVLPVKLASGSDPVPCRSLDGRTWKFSVERSE